MSIPVLMPKLGLTMVEGTVTRWLKQPGERVAKGEVLLQVTTEKLTSDVEAPADSLLSSILAPEGQTLPVGAVLAHLDAGSASASTPAPAAFVPASPYARALAKARGIDLTQVSPSGPRGMVVTRDLSQAPAARTQPVRATPVAERMAAKAGLDLSGVPAAAPDSRIRKANVEAALAARQTPAATETATPVAAAATARREPLSPMRRAISRRMAQSAQTAPHVTLHSDVQADALLALRRELNQDLPEAETLTVTDLLVAVTARGLREFPYMNASLDGDEVLFYDEIHLGLAVALENGLIVPVIRQTDRLSLSQIAAERRRLVSKAKGDGLSPSEVTGGTFTVTNLGSFGIDGFTPIINPPEAAILGVGRVVERPVRQGGEWMPAQFLTLSLSFDHRLVDGAQAARFLQRIGSLIHRPVQLLL